jgi:hypothetical protein
LVVIHQRSWLFGLRSVWDWSRVPRLTLEFGSFVVPFFIADRASVGSIFRTFYIGILRIRFSIKSHSYSSASCLASQPLAKSGTTYIFSQ